MSLRKKSGRFAAGVALLLGLLVASSPESVP